MHQQKIINSTMETKTVQPKNIVVSEFNERQEEVDEDRLETLIESVKQVGVATPVILRDFDDEEYDEEYEVIIGQRRVAAAKEAELFSIPAIVTDWNDEDALAASISENVETFSQNVSTKDRAEALSKLWEEMDVEGEPQASKLSDRLGVSISTISRWLEPLREEWKGTELDPTDTNESVDEEDDEEVTPNPEKRPDDANEFDDDPIDQVGDIHVDEERPAEEDDDENNDYDGIDPYTDGAESKPGLNNDDTESGNLEDPVERETEVPEPEDIDTEETTDEEVENDDEVDDTIESIDEEETEGGEGGEGGEDDEDDEDDEDVLTNLRPELDDLSPVKISCVRRMTGGGDEGIKALELIHEKELSNDKVREVEQRVNNGDDVTEAINDVAEQNNQSGPSTRIHYTVNGELAEEVEKAAEEQSTSVHEVARNALEETLLQSEETEE